MPTIEHVRPAPKRKKLKPCSNSPNNPSNRRLAHTTNVVNCSTSAKLQRYDGIILYEQICRVRDADQYLSGIRKAIIDNADGSHPEIPKALQRDLKTITACLKSHRTRCGRARNIDHHRGNRNPETCQTESRQVTSGTNIIPLAQPKPKRYVVLPAKTYCMDP